MIIRVALISALVGVSACQTPVQAEPAVLRDASPETLAQLKQQLAAAIGRGQVELGPVNLTEDPAIPVLPSVPGPYEDRSPVLPEMFDLVIQEGVCFAQARKTGERYQLDNVSCAPLN